ncbi:MAG: hypothetical protein ACOC44_19995 [Promethearchaeia archaeon]
MVTLVNDKAKKFYEDHKGEIEFAKEHGELMTKAIALTIEELALEGKNGE